MTKRVLIVEDDPSIRQLIKAVLEGSGYDVSEAADGPSALPAAREASPDVILLDIGLPGMDGFGVLGLLKDDAQLRDVPVIMVTAWGEPTLVTKALDRGAHDFVRKPFDVADLSARVDAAARMKEQTDLLKDDVERLHEIAINDSLTGLLNRRGIEQSLPTGPFAALVLDLDHFKAINDDFGHETGDQLLQAIGTRLRQVAGPHDLVGRWGGEEFIVITEPGRAPTLAEALRVAVAERPLDTRSAAVRVTVSVGVAVGEGPLEELLARADEALYDAKSSGRDSVVLALAA